MMQFFISLIAISIANGEECTWCSPPDLEQCGVTDFADWTLVRAIAKSKGSFFSNTDQLQGTNAAFDRNNNEYNIGSFEDAVAGFNQFLFVTGDCEWWLITSTDAVGGPFNNEYYGNQDRSICASSDRATPYTAKWYNDGHNNRPLICVDDWPNKVMYVEYSWNGNNYLHDGGVYIFIRNAGQLDDDGCSSNPCDGKDCDNGIYCDGEEYCDSISGECKDGVDVDCPENMVCSNDDDKCVRDCDSFAIDEYLLECSTEFESDRSEVALLRLDVDDATSRLDGVDVMIQNMNDRIDGFGPYNPAKAEGINTLDIASTYFAGYKDLIIIGLLLMNMVSMIIICYICSKRNDKRYRVVTMQESDDEERSFKQ